MKLPSLFFRTLVAAAIVTQPLPSQAQSLQDGLEVYWSFDEGSGNIANDASGNDREAVPAENLFPGAIIDWSGGRFGGKCRLFGKNISDGQPQPHVFIRV